MLSFDEVILEYDGYHARAEYISDDWQGEIMETGEEIRGRTLEEFEDNFHDALDVQSNWRDFQGEDLYDDREA